MSSTFNLFKKEPLASLKVCCRRPTAIICSVVLGMFSVLGITTAYGQASLQEFGYRNTNASINLLVIAAQYEGRSPLAHNNEYYNNLVFGSGVGSVNGYFLENSIGRFQWTRTSQGLIGPLRIPSQAAVQPEDTDKAASIIDAAMQADDYFAPFDKNRDGKVTKDELALLIIQNLDVGSLRSVPCRKTGRSTVQVCLDVLQVSDRPSLTLLAHELSHFLGTKDIYGRWATGDNLNLNCTLMGPISPGGDGREAFHLDPRHKLQLGWIEPQIRSVPSSGTAVLRAPTNRRADASLLLFDPSRPRTEYFIVEYRSPGSFDQNVCGEGLAIWHVAQDGRGNLVTIPSLNGAKGDYWGIFLEGAPMLQRGGNLLWRAGMTTPPLRWLDGTPTGISIYVNPFSPGAQEISISWDNYANKIFRFDKNDVAKGFQPILGNLVTITSDSLGNTWGVNRLDEIYKYNASTAQFEQRPGALRQIFAGGGSVWGLNAVNSVYRYSSVSQSFERIPGKLIHMVVGGNDAAWGLNGGWQIYRFNRNTQQFEEIPGSLRQLAGRSESNLWGLNHYDQVFRYNPSIKKFEEIPGFLKQIAADTSGNAWGINGKNEIFTYTLTSGRFVQIPGQLVQISVDSGGAVWGLNQNNNIYRFNATTSLFERVEGVLTTIEAGHDSVWGLK